MKWSGIDDGGSSMNDLFGFKASSVYAHDGRVAVYDGAHENYEAYMVDTEDGGRVLIDVSAGWWRGVRVNGNLQTRRLVAGSRPVDEAIRMLIGDPR